mgnify:CR=1 FL=1
MDLWKYYDGDLKYPDLSKHSHIKEVAKVTPKWAFEYAEEHGKDEDLESIIAKDAKYSYWYAKFVLNGPFPLGEPAIASNAWNSLYYAQAINDRFKLGEPAIYSDLECADEYDLFLYILFMKK